MDFKFIVALAIAFAAGLGIGRISGPHEGAPNGSWLNAAPFLSMLALWAVLMWFKMRRRPH